MPPPLLVAIDSGLTVTKAVAFTPEGREVASASEAVPQQVPRPHHVERDMRASWDAAARTIRRLLDQAGLSPRDVAAVSVTGHGDGAYLVDAAFEPVGPAILSLDSRARGITAAWRADGTAERALAATGQEPMVASPAAVLAWVARHEPERLDRTRWVLSCKDWLRLRLTGVAATDATEASVSFAAPETQSYSTDALALFGLAALASKLPPILSPHAVAGHVTTAAEEATGLVSGTPVAAGLHDVTAAAVGLRTLRPGGLTLIAGTYSINEVVAERPVRDPRWLCRSAVASGTWMHQAISPASSANIEWFLQTLCRSELQRAAAEGRPVFDLLQPEIEQAMARPSSLVYHPFLYGSPHSDEASAGFLGLKAWHDRGDMLRAVFEGIVFNHRFHVEALTKRFPVDDAGLAGGGARNPLLAQLFADAIARTVTTVEANEVTALGTALCGAVAVGLHDDLDQAMRVAVHPHARFEPVPERVARLDEAYLRYRATIDGLAPLWGRLLQPAPDADER